MKAKVMFIVGPTAVGKTSLSIQLAKKYNGEIISGDSMQVYRKLDIGTAKVTKEEMKGIIHHLINIRDVDQRFTVADFCNLANKQIEDITRRNKLPIIVGGTGFYIQALLYGLNLGGDDDNDDSIRQRLNHFADINGNYELWKKLKDIDVKAAKNIPVQNRRRIIRAIEVFKKTGTLFSEQDDKMIPKFNALIIGLNTDRSLLYDRINKRVDNMIKNGLLNEARWLFNQGSIELPAGKGIGYRELDPYFKKQISLKQAISEIKKDSRHYAKRQLTWFRNKLNVRWYNIIQNKNELNTIDIEVEKWLNS